MADCDDKITFYINQELKSIRNSDPRQSLLEYLRENNHYGTKYGCGEGGCGACTVVIADFEHTTKRIRYRSANACIIPVYAMNNKQVITVESIGNPQNPHPIQERMAKMHASQCGYCTPGIVMSLYALLKLKPKPSMVDIEEAFDGNLCRCTGYRPILDAARTFSDDKATSCSGSCESSSCDSSSKPPIDIYEFKPYDPTQDLPFPPALLTAKQEKNILVKYEDLLWIEPLSIDELLKFKAEHATSKIIAGNSEIGIEMRFKYVNFKTFINISNINELKTVNINTDASNVRWLEIGANITLTELVAKLKQMQKNQALKSYECSLTSAILSNLKWFASNQVRNFATVAGNIVTASPISDLNPIFVANDAILTILSSETNTVRQVAIRKFYKSYRNIDMQATEILLSVTMPLPQNERDIVRAYKQSKRKDDDIAIVTSCFRVNLDDEFKIKFLDTSYGGLGPTTIFLSELQSSTAGLEWSSQNTFNQVVDMTLNKLSGISYSVPGGMPTYRRTLAVSFFHRFWLQTIRDLDLNRENRLDTTNIEEIEREVSSGKQDFGTTRIDPYMGTTNAHLSALKQTTGVAKYVDDIPPVAGELYASPVLATHAHAYILSIDTAKAFAYSADVVDFVWHKDVPGHNLFGIFKDEEFFASKNSYVGQLVGLIIAKSRYVARQAANLVVIKYENVGKHILTIEEAIEHNSFYPEYNRFLQKGNFDESTFKVDDDADADADNSELVFEGTCRMGGQEHFYLETVCCLVVPKGEGDEYEIYASTQNPTEIQTEVSSCLGVPKNRVVCRTKRIGGGFGGKETRAAQVCAAAAVAAHKLQQPVRCVLDRDVDMQITGTRHPFYGKYKLRITRDGYFKAYDLSMVSNAGCSLDLSCSIMDRALFHCDNVYNFPKQRVSGRLAKTNVASNTAFRGFGGPQGMMMTEMMISEVAEQMGLDPNEIRTKNLYKQQELTHFNQKLSDWYLPEIWNHMMKESELDKQRALVDDFNSKNKYKKRGLALLPTKFGLAFTATFLNQGSALVHIYTDGTVLISIGGVEMGQGLNTKMCQVAANLLQISLEDVFISETSTDKISNGSPTAASLGSDLYGMAVSDACRQLNERLQPYRDANPTFSMKQLSNAAYFDRVCLSAYGFTKVPDLTWTWEKQSGNLFSYFVTGAAMSIVELDLFTGDHVILRTDIYMDIGHSINFALDVGQIEGAFMQGVGLSTIEECLVLSSNGSLFTRGPGNYKIPGFKDVPFNLNIKLLRDKEYKELKTIKSSKGVGEPPLFLGTTVFFALRDAITYARKSNNCVETLKNFASPCTSEILRLACDDSLVQKSRVLPKRRPDETTEMLWSVRP